MSIAENRLYLQGYIPEDTDNAGGLSCCVLWYVQYGWGAHGGAVG
jgi:hypothetical protein